MESPIAAPPRRAALAFIFITVLLDILAFGLIIPVLPHLIKSFVGGSIDQATVWHGLFATAFMVHVYKTLARGAGLSRLSPRPARSAPLRIFL